MLRASQPRRTGPHRLAWRPGRAPREVRRGSHRLAALRSQSTENLVVIGVPGVKGSRPLGLVSPLVWSLCLNRYSPFCCPRSSRLTASSNGKVNPAVVADSGLLCPEVGGSPSLSQRQAPR